ncbi:hypothetical protein GOBAR_DD11870 [Gossypium barbadense]|nr:hypothetical protein GOBAR_DD11870 [Gossypium barbadense]
MGYRKSFVVKRHGGSSGLQIVEEVSTRLKSGNGLDAFILERNEGRLGVNRWWWILSKLGSLIIHLSQEMCGIKRVLYQCENGKGPWLLSSCRRRTTKSVHGDDMVDGSGVRVMVARDRELEWISMDRVLTIDLFTIGCFCHRLQLATDVTKVNIGAFQFLDILGFG